MRKHRPKDDAIIDSDLEEIVDEEENMNSENYLQPRKQNNLMYQNLEQTNDILTPNDSIIKNLTLRDLVRFATEIARGMEYLGNKKVIFF